MTQAPSEQNTKTCPFCAEEILEAAIKCKHCGEFFNKTARVEARQQPGVAALLSFFLFGAGEIYNGRVALGLVFVVADAILWFSALFFDPFWLLFILGLHVYGIFHAYKDAEGINLVGREDWEAIRAKNAELARCPDCRGVFAVPERSSGVRCPTCGCACE